MKAQSQPPLLAGQAGDAGRTFLCTVRKGFPKAGARLGSTSSHFSAVSFLASYSTAANMASNDSSARGKTQRTNTAMHWRPPPSYSPPLLSSSPPRQPEHFISCWTLLHQGFNKKLWLIQPLASTPGVRQQGKPAWDSKAFSNYKKELLFDLSCCVALICLRFKRPSCQMEIPGSKSGKLLKGSSSVTPKMEQHLVQGSHFIICTWINAQINGSSWREGPDLDISRG